MQLVRQAHHPSPISFVPMRVHPELVERLVTFLLHSLIPHFFKRILALGLQLLLEMVLERLSNGMPSTMVLASKQIYGEGGYCCYFSAMFLAISPLTLFPIATKILYSRFLSGVEG